MLPSFWLNYKPRLIITNDLSSHSPLQSFDTTCILPLSWPHAPPKVAIEAVEAFSALPSQHGLYFWSFSSLTAPSQDLSITALLWSGAGLQNLQRIEPLPPPLPETDDSESSKKRITEAHPNKNQSAYQSINQSTHFKIAFFRNVILTKVNEKCVSKWSVDYITPRI